MSHALTQRKDGFVEMAYLGETPWHTLGQQLTEEEASHIDDRAVQKAGMDWLAKRSRVRFGEGENQQIWEDQHVLFRSDTKEPLGIVSPSYEIVQPRECLEFMADLVGEAGFKLDTAGTMFGGRRFWALASIGEKACIVGNSDQVGGYLLVTSSVDGTLATTIKFTTIRVVCNNTLSMALNSKDAGKLVKVSHRTEFDHAKVKAQLGIAHGAFGSFIAASRKLAQRPISTMRAAEMTEQLLVESRTVTKADPRTSKGFENIMALFDHGKGNSGETAWHWVNGVTEWVDHVQRAATPSHRFNNSMLGKGDELKTQALEMALELVK